MQAPFELYVAGRYLLAGRKQAFISVISLISTVGVTVGVMALVIALALTTGLQGEMRDRIVGAAPHIYVWKLGDGGVVDVEGEIARLSKFPGVVAAGPVALGKALVTTEQGEQFITIKGVDPVLEGKVTEVPSKITVGRFEDLAQPPEAEGLPGIVIGESLSQQLGAFVGDTVTLLSPQGTLSPLGVMPRSRRVQVVGIYAVGLYEFDSAYGFVALPLAERLRGKDHPDFIQLKVDDIYRSADIAENIRAESGTGYVVQDWTELNQSLFSALWLEKMVVSITIGLIVVVAALNIVASLVLLVMEKTRDIAILKTMGASSGAIMRIFMIQGLIIGLLGTLVGATAGYLLCQVLDRYRVVKIPMDVYQVSYVPFKVELTDLVVVVVTAVIVCFVATLYPSRQAAKLDPSQALRYQ